MNRDKIEFSVRPCNFSDFYNCCHNRLLYVPFYSFRSTTGPYQAYLGLKKRTWTLIHTRISIILTIAVLIHTLLHYKWLSCTTRNLTGNSKKCEK